MYDDDSINDATIDCPQCGSSVYEDSPRCPRCGEYITDQGRRRNQSPWVYLITLLIVVILILSMIL